MYCSHKLLSYLAFPSFDYERTCWWLFQKSSISTFLCIVRFFVTILSSFCFVLSTGVSIVTGTESLQLSTRTKTNFNVLD